MKYAIFKVPTKNGLDFTIRKIKSLILSGRKDFYVRHRANILLRGLRSGDQREEIRFLVRWVIKNIRFIRDPWKLETLQTARNTLKLKYGDCDDFVILLGSMIMSIGYEVRLVTAGTLKPTHIYLETRTPKGWAPIDATISRWGCAPPLPVVKRYSFA